MISPPPTPSRPERRPPAPADRHEAATRRPRDGHASDIRETLALRDDFTTRPSCAARSAPSPRRTGSRRDGHGGARARRERLRRGVRGRLRAAGRRAPPERAGRRPAGRVLVGGGGEPLVLCAQGVSPSGGDDRGYRARGLELVPGGGCSPPVCLGRSAGGCCCSSSLEPGGWRMFSGSRSATRTRLPGAGHDGDDRAGERCSANGRGRPSSTSPRLARLDVSERRSRPPGGGCSTSPAGRSNARGASTTKGSSRTRSTVSHARTTAS